MSSTDPFQPAREQDAWASLRGFKYQVDTTILRWLALEPDECLELERGEDIDHVAQTLTDESEAVTTRKLEQVKVRERRITLRSPTALEAMANAVCHQNTNASLNLRFRYTTNALIGRERLNPFRTKMPGIELWQHLAQGRITGKERSEVVASLRQFLSLAAKPRTVRDEDWVTFLNFINGADESAFLRFIRRFEWSCRAPDVLQVSYEVRSALRTRIIDGNDGEVEELYQRLFLVILNILTQPGIKRLSPLTLQEQLATPTLSGRDRAILKRLSECFASLEQRVDEVEATVAQISVEVNSLARQHEIRGSIGLVRRITLAIPPLVEHLSRRKVTVAEIVSEFRAKQWLALFGLSDTGKTHLAAIVSQELGQQCAWIRFGHSISCSHAQLIMEDALASLAATGPRTDIVLDDLPNVLGDDPLAESLQRLCDACRETKTRMISTSRFRLPARLSTSLGPERLLETQSPMFSDAEAMDILAAHGAPAKLLTVERARFVNSVACGHPLLITLAARFLRSKQWHLRDEEFTSLIRGEHAAGLHDEVIERVSRSLDQPKRELLYRLTLAIGPVPERVALQLAAVERPIARPRECLASLIGAWVQREPEEALTVSPLVRPVGRGNLAPTTAKECHRVLGDHVVQGRMSPWDAEIAIGHFVAAAEFNRAGTLLLLLLSRLRSWPENRQVRAVLAYWSELPMPPEMELGLRIRIRALQFWVFPEFDKSDDYVLSDLDELMEEVTPDQARSAQLVGTLAALFLSTRDFSRALRFLNKSIAVQRNADIAPDDLLPAAGKHLVEEVWTVITNIQGRAQLVEWLDAVESMTVEEREVVMSSEDATLGCVVLADRLMMLEAKRATEDQDWTEILHAVRQLREWASKHRWGHLESCALRTEINIHGEFVKNVEVCDADVQAFVNDSSRTAPAKSLVAGMYGKMLAGSGSHQDAMPWLKLAVRTPVGGLPVDQMMTLLAAAHSSSITDEGQAIRYAEQAAEIARSNDWIPDVDAAKTFGELAIAIVGRNATRETAIRAYPAWAEAGDRLLRAAKRDNEWKDIFVLFGHIQGFLTVLAGTGQVPTHTADGDEYAAPSPGVFFRTHPDRLDYFRDDAVAEIMWALSEYARSAGDHASADSWFARAIDGIAERPVSLVTAAIRQRRIPEMLMAAQFGDALEAGLTGSEAMVAAKNVTERRGQALAHDESLEALVAEMTVEDRTLVDRFAITAAVIPSFFRIGLVGLSSPSEAAAHSGEIESLCRQVAGTSANPEYWNGAARVFEMLNAQSSGQAILDLANSFDQTQYRELRVLGYLACSLAAGPEDSFRAQLATMETLYSWYPTDSVVHLKLLVPLIEDFWVTKFRESRFGFRSPSLLETALASVHRESPGRRVRAVLRAVRPAFQLSGLKEADDWLMRQT